MLKGHRKLNAGLGLEREQQISSYHSYGLESDLADLRHAYELLQNHFGV